MNSGRQSTDSPMEPHEEDKESTKNEDLEEKEDEDLELSDDDLKDDFPEIEEGEEEGEFDLSGDEDGNVPQSLEELENLKNKLEEEFQYLQSGYEDQLKECGSFLSEFQKDNEEKKLLVLPKEMDALRELSGNLFTAEDEEELKKKHKLFQEYVASSAISEEEAFAIPDQSEGVEKSFQKVLKLDLLLHQKIIEAEERAKIVEEIIAKDKKQMQDRKTSNVSARQFVMDDVTSARNKILEEDGVLDELDEIMNQSKPTVPRRKIRSAGPPIKAVPQSPLSEELKKGTFLTALRSSTSSSEQQSTLETSATSSSARGPKSTTSVRSNIDYLKRNMKTDVMARYELTPEEQERVDAIMNDNKYDVCFCFLLKKQFSFDKIFLKKAN